MDVVIAHRDPECTDYPYTPLWLNIDMMVMWKYVGGIWVSLPKIDS